MKTARKMIVFLGLASKGIKGLKVFYSVVMIELTLNVT